MLAAGLDLSLLKEYFAVGVFCCWERSVVAGGSIVAGCRESILLLLLFFK